jgi:hypothetical protein
MVAILRIRASFTGPPNEIERLRIPRLRALKPNKNLLLAIEIAKLLRPNLLRQLAGPKIHLDLNVIKPLKHSIPLPEAIPNNKLQQGIPPIDRAVPSGLGVKVLHLAEGDGMADGDQVGLNLYQ